MEIKKELEIVEKAKSDIHSFEKIYEYYFPRLFTYLINRIPDKDICEDIISSVFIDAIEGIKKFNTTKNIRFGSWLYKVTHNKIVDYYKGKNKVINSPDVIERQISDEKADTVAEKDELSKKINLILSQLNPRYQQIISLKYFVELSNEEISEVLNLKLSQVSVVLHRAISSFKEKFKQTYKSGEIF